MLRSIEEFYGTQYRSATIPSYEKSVYETAQQEFSASKYKENLKTEAAVIFKMTMQNLKTQETVYRLEKEAAIGMLALGNQDEQKYNDIIERSNEGILRVQSEITRLEVFQQKDIYDAWNMDKFMESYGRESYAQYKIKLSEARKHRNYQDKERKAEVEFNKIRDNLRKQRKHEVKKVQEGNSLLETLLKDYQSEVKRPTGKRASLIRETAARIEVVLSEQVESYKRLEAFGQISELQKSEQEKDLSTFEETRSKIKALLAQTKELGFNVEVQPGVMDVPGRKDQAKIVDPKPHTQRSEMKIPIHGKTRSNEEGTRHRSSVHIKLMKAKEAEVKSAQSLVEAKLQRIELKLAILISSRQMNELQLLEAQGTNREPILHQEAKRLSKEIKELQKEKVDFTYDLDQLKGQKLEFPVEHLSEQEAENELQQADKNTQANTIETKEVSTENAGLFHENQVSQGLAKQAILVRISKLNDQLTASVADFTYDNEMLGAAKISILAKRAKLITQKIRDIEANDTIPPAEKAGIIKVLRELQNENALEQKAISQENKGKVEWANVLDPKEDEPSEVLIEKAKKLTDQLDNLKKEHQVVKSEIIVQRQEDQDFDQTQGPHFAGTLEFLVQDVQRKERQKEQEKDKNNGKTFENRGIGTDQEGQGKDGRNKGPVPPKPPKEQENKGNDQGQNIGGDQEGQGKDGRNKGPVPPVPPKPPKEQENKGNDQGQNIGSDQEGQGKDGRNKGPVPPVPPKPPKEQENKGNDQGQNIGSDQEGQGKDGRNKGPVPPVPPKPPKEQENKGNDQGQNIGGDQEGQGKDGRNKGPVPPVPPKPPKEQENKGNDQGQNIGSDQEGQGKDGRNKGPVPPVPPKPPKEQENKGNDQGQNIGGDQEGQGKDGRNKGPVPPVPPKPPKEQENKGNDQGQNIGGDQEGQGKDGRNKGPVPPVPPKPPKEQENKGNDQGQNIGGDQEGQGKDGRNKGPVPPVPPKPPKEQENKGNDQGQNIGSDQEGQGKDGRNKGPVPPVPPKPPKEQENKGNDQGQNIGGDQEGQGKDGRNKGPVPPVPPKPPKEQENKGNDQGQNIGGDQEGQGKDGRNKGPVPPVSPKPPKEQENKGNDQGQNIGGDQEGQGKDGRNKGPVPPVPPKPPKEQENKRNDQGQNIGGDQEGQGKDGRNKGPVPPVSPKPPKEQENKGNDQGQNIGGDQEGQGKDGRNKGPVPPVPPKPPKEQENKRNDQGQNIGGDQEGQGKDGRNKGPVPPVPPKTTRVEGGTQTDFGETNVRKNKNKRKGQKNRQDREHDPVKDSRVERETQTDLEENNKRRNKRPAPPVPQKNRQLEDERPKEKTTKDNGNNPRKGKNRNVGVNTEPAAITQDEENQPNDKKKRRGLGRYFWHKNRNKRASRGIRWLRYLLNLWPIAAWPLCMTWMTVALPFQLIPVVMPAVIATFTAICLSYYLPKIIRFVRKRLLVRRAKKLGLDVRSYIKQKEMERNQYNQNKVRKFFRRNWKTIAIILGVTALLGGIGLFLVPAVLAPILTASTISGLMAMGGVALTGAAISITVQLFEKFGIVRLEKFFDNKYQQQKMNTREESQKTNGNIIYDHRRHDTNLKKAFTELGHMSINLEKAETVKGTKAKLSEITNKGIVKANTQNVKSMDQQKEQKKKEKAGKENKVVGL